MVVIKWGRHFFCMLTYEDDLRHLEKLIYESADFTLNADVIGLVAVYLLMQFIFAIC